MEEEFKQVCWRCNYRYQDESKNNGLCTICDEEIIRDEQKDKEKE